MNHASKMRICALAVVAGLTLAKAAPAGPLADEQLMRYAAACRQQGRPLEALSVYLDVLLNAGPGQAGGALYQGLADIYYEYLDDMAGARRFYELMLGSFPDQARSALLQHRLARLYARCHDRAGAIKQYRSLLANFPDYAGRHSLAAELKAVEQGDALPDEAGLSMGRIFPGRVRVLVYEGCESIRLAADAEIAVSGPGTASADKIALPGHRACSARRGMVVIEGLPARSGPLRIAAPAQQDIRVNDTAYRGFLAVYADDDRLLVVNHVDLEEYLYGVLPREISPSWPEPALKAQAVAARTYALYNMVKRAKDCYDVFATTTSQVYGGRTAEREAGTRAVNETRGLVLAYGNRLALTLYHANSGGRTEQIDTVWGSGQPYLQGVDDGFSAEQPGAAWRQAVSVDDLQQRLAGFGLPTGALQDIIPRQRAASGRITKLEIVQSGKSFYLTGNSFRLIVGPAQVKSSNFSVARSNGQFFFEGRGYGHGVGLSQWGARSMARQGYAFQDILAFYYPGTEVRRVRREG